MEKVFEDIQPLLREEIQRSLQSVTHSGELCIVRLFYYDTHAPCAYVDFRCVTTDQRRATIQQYQDDGLMYLWGSGEECGDRPRIVIPKREPKDAQEQRLAQLFAMVYSLLSSDEKEYMRQYRSAIQRVALAMNSDDVAWTFPVSDDFVIVPADGSMHFCDDESDVIASVPQYTIELLRSRGFLGPTGSMLGDC